MAALRGAYDATTSSTQKEGSGSNYASDYETGTYADLDQMLDTVIFDSNFTVESFPIGNALGDWGEQGYYPQAALELGSKFNIAIDVGGCWDHRLADNLVVLGSNGKLATAATQLNGSLVLGGYDKANVSGTGYTSPITSSLGRCDTGLFVTLSDVILNVVDGTSSSLFDTDSTMLAACIDPAYPSITTIPLDPYFQNFQTITDATIIGRSEGLNWYSMRYDADQTTLAGDVTLEFASDLSVNIDNAQYIGYDITMNKTTGA